MRSCLLTLVILKGLRFYQFKMSYLRIIQLFFLQESSFVLNFARTELQKFNGRVDVSIHCVLIVGDIFKSKLWPTRYIILYISFLPREPMRMLWTWIEWPRSLSLRWLQKTWTTTHHLVQGKNLCYVYRYIIFSDWLNAWIIFLHIYV